MKFKQTGPSGERIKNALTPRQPTPQKNPDVPKKISDAWDGNGPKGQKGAHGLISKNGIGQDLPRKK